MRTYWDSYGGAHAESILGYECLTLGLQIPASRLSAFTIALAARTTSRSVTV
ncbi:hypothetical protein J2790_002096 [Paenarthrobacter nicotinovorans]|nr:hypothetical protein [Paenarthrobacter nicotinovorans]SCZ55126.1 hypothetical protein SAMN02799638_01662 [Arthrobacter sp. UNCCL28]